MGLSGKGFYIWRISNAENGDYRAIAAAAQQAQFTHALIKVADGTSSYNINQKNGADLVPPVIESLRQRGVQPWGWHYIYGFDAVGEANKAIQRIQQLGLEGYVIDVEGEFKRPGRDAAARQFMNRFRAVLPDFPLALSSYRYPSFHPQIPWKDFLEKCDFNMPQVYWMQNHNPADQLTRSVREFQALVPFRPIIPTGAAFREDGWSPTSEDVLAFMDTARSLNLAGVNFWEWANCRLYLPQVWSAIQDYSWQSPAPTATDITQKYIDALNSRDPARVLALYTPSAVHVTASRTVQGTASLVTWYQSLFKQVLPGAKYQLTGYSGSGSSRHLTWTATSPQGCVQNGNDTFGLVEGKIAYHYSFFTVT